MNHLMKEQNLMKEILVGVISGVLKTVGDTSLWITCRHTHFCCDWLTSQHSQICLWKRRFLWRYHQNDPKLNLRLQGQLDLWAAKFMWIQVRPLLFSEFVMRLLR